MLSELGIEIVSHVVQMGPVVAKGGRQPGPADLEAVDLSPVRCFDPDAEAEMVEAVKAAAKDGDSLGGAAEVIAYGVPVGLGSHVHWDRKIDGLLAQALMSIHAVKAVEIGDGIEVAGLRARLPTTHRLGPEEQQATGGSPTTPAGVEGGITNGEPVVARCYMKPLSTLNRPVLKTVDVVTKEETVSFKERTDHTAVPAMGVVAETMMAWVLAAEALRKFGGRLGGRAGTQPRRLPSQPAGLSRPARAGRPRRSVVCWSA